MIEFFILLLSLASGICLGIFYFGGLWLTLKQLPSTQQLVLLTLGSFLGRSAVCLFSFYLIVGVGHLEGLMISLAGFILAKLVLVSSLNPGKKSKEFYKGGVKWWK
jgi:F1F0 ATPase subunit 2